MNALRFFMGCFWLLCPQLFAAVSFATFIEDVYYRGTSEKVGGFSVGVSADDFSSASPENPIILEVRFYDQIQLAETRVDLTSADSTINRPIFLPLYLEANAENVQIAANSGSLSIVRWKAGEQSVWLKVQSSSSTWVRGANGQLGPPTTEFNVAWDMGIAASSHRRNLLLYSSNMPFPSRNPQVTSEEVAQAEHSLFCLDLSSSNITASGRSTDLVISHPYFYAEGAEIMPGVFQPGEILDIQLYLSDTLARGMALERGAALIAAQSPLGECEPMPAGIRSENFQALLRFPKLDRYGMPLWLHPDSYLELEVPTDFPGGFPEQAAAFLLEGYSPGSLALAPESAFELNGVRLYRMLRLTWTDQSLDPSSQELPFSLAFTSTCATPTTEFKLRYRLMAARQESYADNSPFEQLSRRCGVSWLEMGSGLWNLHEQPGELLLPHLTRQGGGFATQVILANYTEAPATASLLPYLEDGTGLAPIALTLAARETRFLEARALFGEVPVAHCRLLEPASGLGLSAAYRTETGAGTPAHVIARSGTAQHWRFYPAGTSLAWDGFALVNRGAGPAIVAITQFGPTGAVVETKIVHTSLASNAKLLAVLSALFDLNRGAYYEIQTSQPSSLLSLRGSLSSEYLWENPAIAFP